MNSATATDKYMPDGIYNIPSFSAEIDEPKTVLLPYSDDMIVDIGSKSIRRTLNFDETESFSAITP